MDADRAIDGPVDLGNGVMLERLRADDVAEQVIHASLPRGLRHEPTRQFGQLYSSTHSGGRSRRRNGRPTFSPWTTGIRRRR